MLLECNPSSLTRLLSLQHGMNIHSYPTTANFNLSLLPCNTDIYELPLTNEPVNSFRGGNIICLLRFHNPKLMALSATFLN